MVTENSRVFTRIHRKTVLEIVDTELTFLAIETELQFTLIEDGTVLISQHGNQHLSLQFVFQRIPIDIKEPCIYRSLTVLEHIQPPGIIGSHNAHVVGNDVENLSHAVLV